MFAVTTTLPHSHEPISKMTALQTHTKTPKTEAELKEIADAKTLKEKEREAAAEKKAAEDLAAGKEPKKANKKDKKKKKDDEPTEAELFNFTPIPFEEQKVDYKKDMFGK